MLLSNLTEVVASGLAHRLAWRDFRPAQPPILKALASGDNLLVMGPLGSGKTSGAIVGVLDQILEYGTSHPGALYLAREPSSFARVQEVAQACEVQACYWDQADVSERTRCLVDPPQVLMMSALSLEGQLRAGHDWSHLRCLVIDDLGTLIGGEEGAFLRAILDSLLDGLETPPQMVGLSTSVGDPEACLRWLLGGGVGRVVRVPSSGGRRLLEVEHLPEQCCPAQLASVKVRGRRSLVRVETASAQHHMTAGLEQAGLRTSGPNRNCQVSASTEIPGQGYERIVSLGSPGSVSELLNTLAHTDRRPGSVSRLCLLSERWEDFLAASAAVSLAGRRWVEPALPQMGAWPVYLQQLVHRILGQHGVSWNDALEMGCSSAFSGLDAPARRLVIGHLLESEVLYETEGYLVLGAAGEAAFDNNRWTQLGRQFKRPSRFVLETRSGRQVATADNWLLEVFSDFSDVGEEQYYSLDEMQTGVARAVVREADAPSLYWSGPLRLWAGEFCEEVRSLLVSSDAPPFLDNRNLRNLERLRKRWKPLLEPSQSLSLREVGEHSYLYTFAGGRVNAAIARLHHARSGESVCCHNLFVRTHGGRHELLETLANLADELSEESLASLAAGIAATPLEALLPDALRHRYLAEKRFELEGARRVAQAALQPVGSPVSTAVPSVSRLDIAEPFVAQLAKLAQEEPTRCKWVFVPDSNLAWVLGERLVRAGVNWVNFRFTTPFQVALELAAPQLLADGIHPKPEGLGPELVLKLLLESPPENAQYFRPLAKQPRMSSALWNTLRELRSAGVSSEQLPVETFAIRSKGEELRTILRAYESYLQDNQLGDRATVLEIATELAGESPVNPTDLVLDYPSVPWLPLERRFLDALQGQRVPSWVPTLAPPRRWASLCPYRKAQSRAVVRDSHLLGQLKGGTQGKSRRDGTLRLFCAGRRDSEIQEVLRRVLEHQVPLDEVEIGVHDPDSLALLWDKMRKHQLPATLERGIPVSSTAPGRALLGLLEWSESRFAAFHLRELLLAGVLKPAGISPSEAARMLGRSKAKWGRDTYDTHLGAVCARYRRRAQKPEIEAQEREGLVALGQRADNFLIWVKRLLEQFPRATEEGLDIKALVGGLLTLLSEQVVTRSDLDRAAQRAMSRLLGDLSTLADQRWSPEQCHRLVREKLEALSVGGSRPLAGMLHVTTPDRLGRSGREQVYIIGLEEGTLFSSVTEDPVLNDTERESLHPDLPTSRDRAEEASFHIFERLACLGCHVTLSYSCRDYRSGEALHPSRLFFQVARLLHPEVVDYSTLAAVLGEPVGFAPSDCERSGGDAEWWLARLSGAGLEAQSVVLGGFPWLSRGRLAECERQSDLFTAFDGWVPQAARRLDPRHNGQPISVSRLQGLAGCPYRTFLEHALDLQALELEPPDLERWLTAADRGTALHETFSEYYRELRGLGIGPSEEHYQHLLELLSVQLEIIRQTVPAPSDRVEAEETLQLHRDLRKFLRLEMAGGREVVACEVGFGLPDLNGEPLATAEAVTIELGPDLRFALRGRIDRIDRLDEGFEVVDYKTGRKLNDDKNPRYSQGRLLQHALYAIVAQKLLGGATVLGSSYYFPVVRAQRDWVRFGFPSTQQLREVLLDVLEPLQTGAFVHTARADSVCHYCDFRAACSVHSDASTRAKQANPANTALECRRRLERVR